MPNRERPLVVASVLCDQILEGKDGALSVIRIIDQFLVDARLPRPKGTQAGLRFSFLLMLKRGHASEQEFKLDLAVRLPSAKKVSLIEASPVSLPGNAPHEGVNLAFVGLVLPVTEDGVHWLEAVLDGQQIATIPFEVIAPGGLTRAAPRARRRVQSSGSAPRSRRQRL